MFISDLNYMEACVEKNIEGGLAFSDAYGRASASGKYFAATYTSTYTKAYSGFFGSSAYAGSSSSSTAA